MKNLVCATLASAVPLAPALAQAPIVVTPDNYVEAEVDTTFAQILRDTGG
jgi:hypothetical protein